MNKPLSEQTDEELLQRLAEGEASALDVLYMRHSGRVLSYTRRRGLSPERCEDLLQIVFMQLYRKKHLYDSRYRALAWLYVITRSEVKDYRNREMKDFQEWEESLSQATTLSPNREEREEARKILQELPAREQEAIRLRYLDEMEYSEMATLLSESEVSLRQRVSRGLRQLRALVKKN
ncbi:MAG: sigma-70 family RNA polymerase sigma factor [Bdellovibrio sp.]